MSESAVDVRTLGPDGLDPAALALDERQRTALTAWQNAWSRASSERAATTLREAVIDLDRRLDVLRRQHAALLAAAPDGRRPATGGALVAHRDERAGRQIAALLAERGHDPVVVVDNGADVVGLAVLRQPELVVVDAPLAMMTAHDVVAEVHAYAPGAVVVACADGAGPALLQAAGARATYRRGAPATEIARHLDEALGARQVPPPRP